MTDGEYYLHFPNKETEVQESQGVFPRSLGNRVGKLGLKPMSFRLRSLYSNF